MNSAILDKIAQDLGTYPTGMELSESIFRFGEKLEFWAWGTTFIHSNNSYCIVKYGSWKTGQKFEYRDYDPREQSKQFQNKHNEIVKRAKEKLDEDAKAKHEACKQKWAPRFKDMLANAPVHEYLVGKQAKSNYSARVDRDTLYIPVENEGELVGVQMIFRDQDGKFIKRFSSGVKLIGSYTKIAPFDIKSEQVVYLCEGFATGCTIFEVTGMPTLCAFNASNLIEVIRAIRIINPSIKIILCADNDHETIVNGKPCNVGVEKAEFIKHRFSNIVVLVPEFENQKGLSDFNDLFIASGNEVTKDQLKINESFFMDVILLGHRNGIYYYTSTQTQEIHDLNAANHNRTGLGSIAHPKYWGDRYGTKENGQVDWDQLGLDLMEEQRVKGKFYDSIIRGRGSWIDYDNYVFNYGKQLSINGRIVPISSNQLQTDYHYQPSEEIPICEPLENVDSAKIIEAFQAISYRRQPDSVFLIGWIALGQIPGFLPWRPHIWVTGESGAGKTTIMRAIANLCYKSKILNDVTASGVKQNTKTHSLPVFIDELESNNKDSKRKTETILELVRQSSSGIDSFSVRGSSSGNPVFYSLSNIYCLSSIQPLLPTQADSTRVTVIELSKNKDKKHYLELCRKLDLIEDFTYPLLARIIKLTPIILDNFKIINTYIQTHHKGQTDQRQRDQIGHLVAGYLAVKHDHLTDEFELDELFAAIDLAGSSYIDDTEHNETQVCWDEIMQIRNREEVPVGIMVEGVRANPLDKFSHEELAKLGIRVMDGELCIQVNSVAIRSSLRKTESQFVNYAKVLDRHPAFIKRKSMKLNGLVVKALVFKLE